MDRKETIQLLGHIHGLWFKQPADEPTIRAWQSQSGELSYSDCRAALDRLVEERAAQEPPAAVEIFKYAKPIWSARIDRENQHRRLNGPERQWPPGTRVMVAVMSPKDGSILRHEPRIADENGHLRPVPETPPETELPSRDANGRRYTLMELFEMAKIDLARKEGRPLPSPPKRNARSASHDDDLAALVDGIGRRM